MPVRILVTPLNWGLGHVTRCIPIIRQLLSLGAEPVLAADGEAYQLLKAEFPKLTALELPSYGIRYDTSSMVWNIGRQLPKLLWAVRAEYGATQKIVKALGIRGVISDNRYGCYSPFCPSAIISHQLKPIIPWSVLTGATHAVVRKALSRFDAVWVPDHASEHNLTGKLSHNTNMHPHIHFVGPLSRMKPLERDVEYDVAVVLSGPEPQRTRLEQLLLEQAIALPHRAVIIQGKPMKKSHYFAAGHVEVISYLTSSDLNNILSASQYIVCRSGYSSIMDLAVLGKKALLIPTPGQTEQEFLARSLGQKNYCAWQQQHELNLRTGLAQLESTTGIPDFGTTETPLETLIGRFLSAL